VTIRYFLSVGQECGSERERAFIVREEEEVVGEGDGEGRTRKEQMEEEEGITVPSFPRPANSFQGSRTFSTEPNSKVIAPVPTTSRNPYPPRIQK